MPMKMGETVARDLYKDVTRVTVADLYLLAKGCKRHPAYRAKRPPRLGLNFTCGECERMWTAAERLRGEGWDL